MLISYFVGKKIGKGVVDKLGKWMGVRWKRLDRVEGWFEK